MIEYYTLSWFFDDDDDDGDDVVDVVLAMFSSWLTLVSFSVMCVCCVW